MTAPADRAREQLAAALPESLGPVGLRHRAVAALGVEGTVTGYGEVLLDALMPTVAAIVERAARERAAAELRAAADAVWVVDGNSMRLQNDLRARAAALEATT